MQIWPPGIVSFLQPNDSVLQVAHRWSSHFTIAQPTRFASCNLASLFCSFAIFVLFSCQTAQPVRASR